SEAYFLRSLSYFYLVRVFLSKKTSIRIQWRLRNVDLGVMGRIAAVGFPQAAGLITMSVSFMFFNLLVVSIDRLALTAFALCLRFDQVMIVPLMAIGSALITMIGQNYGRGNHRRVLHIWRTGTLVGMGTSALLGAVLFTFAPRIFPFFTDVEEVVGYAVLQLRIVVLSFIGAAVVVVGRSAFQAVGRPLPGLIVTALRLALIALPTAYLLVHVLGMGMYGVWLGMVAGNLLSAAAAFAWVRGRLRASARQGAASRRGLPREAVSRTPA
ncbi:MAG: MATE family efflux transporter, partial [Spirochaetota bacterium]